MENAPLQMKLTTKCFLHPDRFATDIYHWIQTIPENDPSFRRFLSGFRSQRLAYLAQIAATYRVPNPTGHNLIDNMHLLQSSAVCKPESSLLALILLP